MAKGEKPIVLQKGLISTHCRGGCMKKEKHSGHTYCLSSGWEAFGFMDI